MRSPYLALAALVVGAIGCVQHHPRDEYDEDRGEDRHPIDHFTTRAVFLTKLYTPASPDAVPWPKPGSTVELAEVSCSVLESKTGRTVKCVPGYALEKKFAALLRDDDPPLGKAMKERLAECYDVHAKPWSAAALLTYEVALRQSALAVPPAVGDGYVIAYVAHDEAPFVGKCKPEPDGTCLYTASQEPEATVVERVARGGKEVTAIPFTPETRKLALTFFDGRQGFELTRVRLAADGHETEPLLDPTKVAWEPIVAWYAANEPTSANFGVALVLAGRIADARGLGAHLDLDRDDYLAKDPCAK